MPTNPTQAALFPMSASKLRGKTVREYRTTTELSSMRSLPAVFGGDREMPEGYAPYLYTPIFTNDFPHREQMTIEIKSLD